VAFLDFGCVKVSARDLVAGMKRYMGAAMDEDWHEFDRACVEVLGYDPDDESWELYRSYTMQLLMPIVSQGRGPARTRRRERRSQYLTRGIKSSSFKEGETLPQHPARAKMPQEFTFVNRLQWGLASVMAGLGTVAHFRPIVEGWIRGPVHPVPGE
jgi:hypothetical protein